MWLFESLLISRYQKKSILYDNKYCHQNTKKRHKSFSRQIILTHCSSHRPRHERFDATNCGFVTIYCDESKFYHNCLYFCDKKKCHACIEKLSSQTIFVTTSIFFTILLWQNILSHKFNMYWDNWFVTKDSSIYVATIT